jgi:hypothetical protein
VILERIVQGLSIRTDQILYKLDNELASGFVIVTYIISYLPIIPICLSGLMDFISILLILFNESILQKDDNSESTENAYDHIMKANLQVPLNYVEPVNDNIIINNPHNFLNFANINQIMIDKTKTITTGEMEIFSVYFRRKKYELDKEGGN